MRHYTDLFFEVTRSGDAANLVLAAILLAAVLAIAETVRGLGVAAEWTRRLVHVLSGLVCATFPWLFTSAFSVVLLAASYVALMEASRRSGWLWSVHGVRQPTAAGVYYPVAVASVFVLAGDRPAAYVPAILALTVGDAAALAGHSLGSMRYRLLGATRSLEGSMAMAVSVYGCVHVSLAVLTSLETLECVLWSLSVALLTTMVEAVAPDGSDNFFVPVTAAVCLLVAA